MALLYISTLVVLLAGCVSCLDNGLARTPPMGWLDWERFRCNMDCVNDPNNCIGEKLFMDMADVMVRDGFKDAGYEYVIIDDCWLAPERDAKGRLQPDPKRFPHGIKALADYIHAKGLKFGIYEDFGTKTCAGFPGSEFYLQLDAQTFADWTVDYVKLDGCNSDMSQYEEGYTAMTKFLNLTGRPMLYSCSWPAYMETSQIKPNYPLIAQSCNIWRNYDDIDDSWDSVASIIEFYGQDKTGFAEIAGPGHFNDPDMLIIGNYGLSYDQQRTQMALWCLMASPLIMSVDLRIIRHESRALLQNRNALAINQDTLGIQGRRIKKIGSMQVWTKPIVPQGSFAFVFLNMGTATPTRISISLSDMGMMSSGGYNITEVFDGKWIGEFKPSDKFTTDVNPGGVFFGKSIVL